MQIDFNEIEFLVGEKAILEQMTQTPVLPTFSEEMMSFLSELSKSLMKDKRTRNYVDVMSYAYWIRRASLESARTRHRDFADRIGRGIAFHIAPSNVPVNFAVSMTSSLLAGNITLIRVSDKAFEQVDIIADAINGLLSKQFSYLRHYICLIRYRHSEEITRALSAICDVRIIWGGNRTIETIRRAPLAPRAIELAFADRYSLAIIDADQYLQCDAKEIAKGFYTDTYYTDQNACSSPRLVVWLGKNIRKARKQFWEELEGIVRQNYEMKPIQAVDKYTSACTLGMLRKGQRLVSKDNLIVRIEVEMLEEDLMDYKNGGGYFFEYSAKDLKEILPVLGKQCQTVSVLGVEKKKVKQLVFAAGVRGVDRIVSLGQTMGLEFIWDGYKMIESMGRVVYAGGYE